MDWRNIAERAIKTFIQAFVASISIDQNITFKSALISAGAAGLSAVWNLLQCTILKQEETDGDK